MTSKEFYKFWNYYYPEIIPLSHYFKNIYKERWFRIHSLPNSKHSPENENEWNILLNRQNSIIDDFLGEGSDILVVVQDYSYTTNSGQHITKTEQVFYFQFICRTGLH